MVFPTSQNISMTCYSNYYCNMSVSIINFSQLFVSGGGGENYVPEDLISLLDAGINSDHPSVIIDAYAMFSEEMFSYSGQARQATLARSSSSR